MIRQRSVCQGLADLFSYESFVCLWIICVRWLQICGKKIVMLLPIELFDDPISNYKCKITTQNQHTK